MRVQMLKTLDDQWCMDEEELKEMVRGYYISLYTAEACVEGDETVRTFPKLSHSDIRWLNYELFEQEIRGVVVQMGVYKAPAQKVNLAKSKLFFSRKVGTDVKYALSGIPRTNNLGTYLGMSFLHKLVTRNTYGFVVDKFEKKLSA
ncbi:LOW QUALITY PROTEIN: hypothetical protein M9H77_15863 [Catharanthus roseus]|uniref:Uncharacterized protein n=1 Tax=Catharanthus roseus TaxID=4058 RepID=A0ACC0AYS2_CATRO|nr:LOW QUALITY PROTEIN: hypothetical protein M9H77_15863 [Catharanthus roseus]